MGAAWPAALWPVNCAPRVWTPPSSMWPSATSTPNRRSPPPASWSTANSAPPGAWTAKSASMRLAGMLARKGYSEGLALRVVKQALEEEGEDPDLLEEHYLPDA